MRPGVKSVISKASGAKADILLEEGDTVRVAMHAVWHVPHACWCAAFGLVLRCSHTVIECRPLACAMATTESSMLMDHSLHQAPYCKRQEARAKVPLCLLDGYSPEHRDFTHWDFTQSSNLAQYDIG